MTGAAAEARRRIARSQDDGLLWGSREARLLYDASTLLHKVEWQTCPVEWVTAAAEWRDAFNRWRGDFHASLTAEQMQP